EHIAGANYVELPGVDHLPWVGGQGRLLDEVQEFLTGSRLQIEPDRVLVTVLFTDIVGSTEMASEMGDRRWREVLESHNAAVERELKAWRGHLVKSTGDGILATFDGPGRAIRCAAALARAVTSLGVRIRAGLHTGECELLGEDIGGISVHIAARVAAAAEADEVLVSRTVKDLVAGSGIEFESRGERALKGVPGEWEVFVAKL
ncbi:MAG: adenylate/guanylate cyclase domain-containing protein, partial [Chloroflexota bacterium]